MNSKWTQRLTVVGTLVLFNASSAFAQFDGLDLSDTAPAPAPAPKKNEKPAKGKKGAESKVPVPVAAPASAAEAKSLELDLSSTADVRAVLVVPPIVKVTASQGGFSGFDTKKTTERFDNAAHKRLVTAFEKQLEGKVIPAELTQGVIAKEGITPALLRTPAGLQKLAKATNVEFMVLTEFNKTGTLAGNIYDASGKQQGQPSFVNNAAGIPQKAADEMASSMAKQLVDVSRVAHAAQAAVAAEEERKRAAAAPPMISPEDEVSEPATAFETTEKRPFFMADASKPRLIVSVGPGAVFRSFDASGSGASTLAELRNNGSVGLGVYAQIAPLQFIEATAGKRWSDLEIEVNWRRAFVTAKGTSGSIEGQNCSMTDDDLQLRGTYRYKIGDSERAPLLGVGGGYSQERTEFACNFPVVSTTYRGVDAQLRYKQPIYKSILAIDVAVGPRFLFSGPSASQPGFSIGGELWLEVKPVTYLFGRAGGRISRLSVSNGASLAVVDTRMFFALEVGAFL